MQKKSTLVYLVIFAVLTWMTWSPLGYGSYGVTGRTFGLPTWTVIALLAATGLFVVEWIFLFSSGLALKDEAVSEIVDQIKADTASIKKVVAS